MLGDRIFSGFRVIFGVLCFCAGAMADSATVKIVPTQPYTDTGIQVLGGQGYTITTTGLLNWFTGGCPSGSTCLSTPEGQSCPYTGFALPGAPCWSLIGKVGANGTAFHLGATANSVFAESGELYLGVNDNNYGDNTGGWTSAIATNDIPSCLQLISHAVTAGKGGSPTFTAQLTIPGGYKLSDAETACQVDNFDWQQTFLYLPSPSPWWKALDPCVTAHPATFTKDCPSLSAPFPATFQDPPQGGYLGLPYTATQYPFTYDPSQLATFETSPNTLSYLDMPTDVCLPTGPQNAVALAQFITYCGGEHTLLPGFMLLETALVGVKYPHTLVALPVQGYDDTIIWESTFNGTAGSVSVPSNTAPVDSGSGTGSVTVLMANGISTVSGPLIYPEGIVDAARFQANAALAPGSIAAVFGNLFVGPTVATKTTPLPTSLSGLAIKFGTVSAPLFFASAGQVNIQIPWETGGSTEVFANVTSNGVSNAIGQPVGITPFAPAIFSADGTGTGQGAIQDQNYKLVDSSNPAVGGVTTIQIYCTGLGAVTNPPATGHPTPAQPFSQTLVNPSVTIGGVTAPVVFSGLTPGTVGLYQINAQVPASVPAGQENVIVSANGITSNTVTIAVQ
jgi:uncharacterized protein (TIGR03437 family)